MNLAWNDERTRKFATNVGLITSNGPYGNNIMAAEWTFHVSYAPSLIMVNLGPAKATSANIKKSREFGMNLAAEDQSVVCSVAGGNSGRETDKIKVLKEMGVEFYKAKKINTLMINGSAMNAECKLVKSVKLGDHTAFIGEIVEISADSREPLIYHNGKYWKTGERIQKPPEEILRKIEKLIEKYAKK